MQEEQGPVHAPEFPPNVTWLQGGPLKMADLRGRPVLIDFWDYTCLNCLRTLPYVKEWHRRYSSLGLQVVGVHAPEFSFAREHNNVVKAVREQGIEYPVVLDNEYAIWQAYANRYWPAKYLVDAQGYIRGYHHGEGAYRETEEALQALLRESFPGDPAAGAHGSGARGGPRRRRLLPRDAGAVPGVRARATSAT